MAGQLVLEHSRTYPVAVDAAYDATLGVPLDQVFDRRHLLIAPVVRLEGQDGPWGTVGQTRTVVLGDGSTMREELVETAPGQHFGYHLGQVTGPLRALIGSVDGRWAFEPAGTGTRVTWTWRVDLLQPQGRVAAPVLARLWQGFARKGFERLEDVLLRAS